MLIGAALLGSFAIFGSGLLAVIHDATKDTIAEKRREALLKSLNQVIDPALYDNALESDTISIDNSTLNADEPTIIYRARKNGQPTAAVMTVTAPDGYNGKIKMLVAVNTSGNITGVRIVKHTETPGLGDKVDITRDDWVLSFNGRSLSKPTIDKWKVTKDGGEFDSFTGATITPRAVVKAVSLSLQYFQNHQDTVFQ